MASTTWWRGVLLDTRSADMMAEVAATTPDLPRIIPIQGSYSTAVSASSDTHAGAGAIDLSLSGWTDTQARDLETAMRRVGWAAWWRPVNWDRRGGGHHVHAIAIAAAGLSAGARRQVQAYRDGLDGLVFARPDTGNRDYVTLTWETYTATKHTPPAPSPAPAPAGVIDQEVIVSNYLPPNQWMTYCLPADGRRYRLGLGYSGKGPRRVEVQPHTKGAAPVGPPIVFEALPAGARWEVDTPAGAEQVSILFTADPGQWLHVGIPVPL